MSRLNVMKLPIPADWDQDFLIDKINPQMGFGFTLHEDTSLVWLNFDGRELSKFEAGINAYSVDYLQVAAPKKLRAISDERDRRIRNFQFGPFVINLQGDAKRDLADAALGLMRNPDLPGIDWSIGAGHFFFIPRETLLQMADAAFLHVQGAFSAHKRLATAVKQAGNVEELATIDELADSSWAPPAETSPEQGELELAA
jgi:hypothetical protein